MQRLNRLAEAVAFTPLGILLGILFGATSTFWVMRHLPTEPSLIQHPTVVLVTALHEQTAGAVREPTLPPALPHATAIPDPTARPVCANYTV